MKDLACYLFLPKEYSDLMIGKNNKYKIVLIIIAIIMGGLFFPIIDYIFSYNTISITGFKIDKAINHFPIGEKKYFEIFSIILFGTIIGFFLCKISKVKINFLNYLYIIILPFYHVLLLFVMIILFGSFLLLLFFLLYIICFALFLNVFYEGVNSLSKDSLSQGLIFIYTIVPILFLIFISPKLL